jgi:hypothetical protein
LLYLQGMNSTPCTKVYRVTKADVACGGWHVQLSEADYRASGGRISWSGTHGPFESEAVAVAWAQSQGAIKPWHQHAAAKRNYTHDTLNHGFDRCVETCACGAKRVLTRECGESGPAYTEWS